MADINFVDSVKSKFLGSANTAYVLRDENGSVCREIVTMHKGIRVVVPYEEYFKVEVLNKHEYRVMFGNVTPQSIDYLIQKNIIDYVRVGKTVIIVMSDITKQYKPNSNKNRGNIGAKLDRV